MKKYLLISLIPGLLFFVDCTRVDAKGSVLAIGGVSRTIAGSSRLPYDSIEDAVRASGGTYGVIDTSDLDAANSYVQTISGSGLTNSDRGRDCWSTVIRPGVKISCALSVNKDAYYYYEGKKGEKVTVTVSAKNFVPEIDISDANGDMEFFDNKQKQNFITINKTLTYSGKYTFEIRTRYNTETKEGEAFTISLASDRSNIRPDIRDDDLVQGKKYTVKELTNNQSKTARTFLVTAFVVDMYKDPSCPPEAYSCPISLPPNITIADDPSTKNLVPIISKKTRVVLYVGNKYDFKIGNKYTFEISVVNTSDTDIPQNNFSLIAVRDWDRSIVSTKISTTTDNTEDQKTFIFTKTWQWFKNLFR